MKVLILSGSGAIDKYVYDKAIKFSYITCKHLDTLHYSKICPEVSTFSAYAHMNDKGLCILTQRYEIVKTVVDHFQGNDYVECLSIDNSGSVNVYCPETLKQAIHNNWEIR